MSDRSSSNSELSDILDESANHPRIRTPSEAQTWYKYAGDSESWLASDPENDIRSAPSTFAVLTWNIDFSRDLPVHRLKTVLNHLESELLGDPSPRPTIILFQEVHKSCFHTLLSHPFVRSRFQVTDISPSKWPGSIQYGTVTLIPNSIASIVSVFRTPFSSSRMGRDALYVDFEFLQRDSDSMNLETRRKIKIRVANAHLESLLGYGDKARPAQLKSISQLISSPGIYGGIVGGDMNAISPSDLHLPEQVGLSDAWTLTHSTSVVATSKEETDSNISLANQISSDADSYTWGYQPPSRFPPGRLDKILFVGGLKVDGIRRVGVGLKYERPPGIRLGPDRPLWASDHYGLLANFTLVEQDTDPANIPAPVD
ncbi:Endonuclease/exonuclease/phosphatase [Collybia nuda]|uniref:Endonuclease/exonuclease/phosphatase n=1 Tax=Collybia nuda TaxID=64659 RepID=A0A9P6CJZ8_9AGAR|nr:Endonuclease/exonuclease/phosphatase [Collybia nuda]